MTANRMRLGMVMVIMAALAMIVGGTSSAFAAGVAPVKQVIESHIGSNVNKTKEQAHAAQAERNICTVASKDECQPGRRIRFNLQEVARRDTGAKEWHAVDIVALG